MPSDTLVGAAAAALGVRGKDDLFGAVVSHPFVATKSITHALADAAAVVPDGWSPGFAAAVDDVVLRGASAFSSDDALRAARALLERDGEVRVKRATGIGGGGQHVVCDEAALREVLDALPADELATYGIVVEENLRDVRTYSVGRIEAAGVVATLLRHAVPDPEQPRRRGLRRLGAHGRARRIRAAARARPAGPRCAPPSTRRAATTGPPMRISTVSSRRGGTTTWSRESIIRGARAPACSSSRGASAARAAPSSARSR